MRVASPHALLQESEEEEEPPQGQTSISVAVDLVSLQVLVTDKKGNVIVGLKPENFTIYEDNVKQEISHFSSIEANITVVMLVEFSRQVQYFITDVWNSMYYFANSLRKDDWVAVIAYDMRPTILCDFTQDRQKLYDTLRRFTIPAYDDSNLSDALIDALDRVEEIDGKVAILLISTGLDTFSRHTYEEALEKCKQSNASIYAVSLGQYFRLRAEAAGLISSITNMELLMGDNRLRDRRIIFYLCFCRLHRRLCLFPPLRNRAPGNMQEYFPITAESVQYCLCLHQYETGR